MPEVDRSAVRKTIVIDFDGTICEFDFPNCGKLMPGVKEAIDKLKEKYIIVISSCRTSALFKGTATYQKFVDAMIDYLDEHEIFYNRIDHGNEGKVVGMFYIDDRAIRFDKEHNNWDKIAEEIQVLDADSYFPDLDEDGEITNA